MTPDGYCGAKADETKGPQDELSQFVAELLKG